MELKNRNMDVRPLTDFMYRKASAYRLPISGTFELTPMCNFSCRMCYVRKSAKEVQESSRKMFTLEDWISIAKESCEQGMLYLLLTGGEPTAWPDFWKLYPELIQMGLLVSMNTNGSLIDDKAIQRFIKLPPKRINITLYGASDETYKQLCGVDGMFTKVDRAITGLKEAGISIKLNCSLTPYNAKDLEKMVAYAEERQLILDVATYMFPPIRRDVEMIGMNDRFSPQENAYYRMKVYELQHDKEAYVQYLNNIQKGSIDPPGLEEGCVDPVDGRIRCRAGKASYWITWDRYLTPCGMMNEPKIDLYEKSFKDAWTQLINVSENMSLSGICQNCQNNQLCHACAAMAMTETGKASGIPTYLCETIREMKKLTDLYLKQLKK